MASNSGCLNKQTYIIHPFSCPITHPETVIGDVRMLYHTLPFFPDSYFVTS